MNIFKARKICLSRLSSLYRGTKSGSLSTLEAVSLAQAIYDIVLRLYDMFERNSAMPSLFLGILQQQGLPAEILNKSMSFADARFAIPSSAIYAGFAKTPWRVENCAACQMNLPYLTSAWALQAILR